MRNYLKLSVVLPVVIGIITGAALPLLGAADDAPGLSLIGIVAAFLLMMWGVYNTGLVKRSLLVSIALICFGAADPTDHQDRPVSRPTLRHFTVLPRRAV